MSTQEHIRRIQVNGDEAAFNELYGLHEPKLNKFAYSFLGDREVAQEIVNDAFLKIWTGRRKGMAARSQCVVGTRDLLRQGNGSD